METEQVPLPSPADAATALREVEQARRALDGTVPPWWYFVAMAALVSIIPVVQLLPSTPLGGAGGIVGIACWATVLALVIRTYLHRVGFTVRLQRAKLWQLAIPGVDPFGTILGATGDASLALLAAQARHLAEQDGREALTEFDEVGRRQRLLAQIIEAAP